MKKIAILLVLLTLGIIEIQSQTVVDIDGNIYNTVNIGSQVWLKQNLKVIHYNNGDSIPNIKPNIEWCNLAFGSSDMYCNYNNDTNIANEYGRLYHWNTIIDNRKVCPIGWRVPDTIDWNILIDFLGGINVAGGKLKETESIHWQSPNVGANNSSGFTALPGGYRYYNGIYEYINSVAAFWTSSVKTPGTPGYSSIIYLRSDSQSIIKASLYQTGGLSVRCVKDVQVETSEINYINNLNIYPNPAIDKIYINCDDRQNLIMQIYNINGVSVLKINLKNGINGININSLPKGFYLLNLSNSTEIIQQKLIKK